ncbi:MAG TPA: SatD family protein [Woeseiaceae bacterium]|nr:SatD family protein [Woeseiaceae bacterium]
MPPSRRGSVLLVDVADSSSKPDFRNGRDRRIARLTEEHRERGWIAADYTVTAWDEFQSVSWERPHLPQIFLDIRQVFAPWEVYIAVGCGQVSGWESSRPINEALSGEGFERARAAMDALKSSKGDKYRRLSQFVTGDSERDALLNLIYGLHDSLVQQVTERQWETIRATLELKNQEDVAEKLGVQPSTVTRNLKRGHYWQMRETAAVVSALLGAE